MLTLTLVLVGVAGVTAVVSAVKKESVVLSIAVLALVVVHLIALLPR